MRQRLARLFDRLSVVRGEGQQILVTRRAIRRHLTTMRPDHVGHPQAEADLARTNRRLLTFGATALRTLMTV